jgi:transmembrane sensor
MTPSLAPNTLLMEGKEYYKSLLEKYMTGTASEEEAADLFEELGRGEDTEGWAGLIAEITTTASPDPQYDAIRWEPVINRILGRQEQAAVGEAAGVAGRSRGKVAGMRPLRWLVAASAVILLALGGLYLTQTHHSAPPVIAVSDRQPGGNRATLILSGGQTILLDSATNGTLARQGGSKVTKLQNGLIIYAGNAKGEIMYNTLTTPRGGQYQVTLPDGTRVWLNASSSIHYPTAFTGKKRAVDITGEAYFQVAPHPGVPFTVTARHQLIEEIGTHFDVNAYTDETELRTTLLEGAVRVGGIVLQPGEQAIQQPDVPGARVITVDTAAAVAWKNGLFDFNQVGIAELMRQLARWYDVEIVYEGGKIPDEHFYGAIGRDLTLAQVLAGLEQTHVHFRIEGRTIKVLP